MIITGIDPGGTTGAIMLDVQNGEANVIRAEALGVESFFAQLPDYVALSDVIGAEQYTISARTIAKTRQPDALHVIGALRYLCFSTGTLLKLQLVADAKTAFTDHVLRSLGLYHGSKHVRDATRHALLAARRSGNDVHFDV